MLMIQHGCAFQEEDSAQGPEEEPTEEPENHDQVEPIRQNDAAQHHPEARPEREWGWDRQGLGSSFRCCADPSSLCLFQHKLKEEKKAKAQAKLAAKAPAAPKAEPAAKKAKTAKGAKPAGKAKAEA